MCMKILAFSGVLHDAKFDDNGTENQLKNPLSIIEMRQKKKTLSDLIRALIFWCN